MKFPIKKKIQSSIFENDTKRLLTPNPVLNEKYVNTGYCSNGTPFINKKEAPLLKQQSKNSNKVDLNTSGGNLTKNFLLSLKNTTKMKHKSKAKQANNALGGNMGSKTLKSIGVSFGNLFKPSKRMGKNEKRIIVDASAQLSDVYFPPIFRVVDKNFKSQQMLAEISSKINTPPCIQVDFISKSCQVGRRSTQLLANISGLSQTSKTRSDLNLMSNASLTPTIKSGKLSTRKTQPSMGVGAMVIKSKKTTMSSMSSQYFNVDKNSSKIDSSEIDKMRQKTERSIVNERMKEEEEIYQNVSFWSKLNTINQTYLIDTLKNQNSTLKSQDNDDTLTKTEFSFDKYLIPSVCVESSPEMEPVSTSTSMSSLSQQAQHGNRSNTEHSILSNAKPTPFVKFGMQQRAKKLRAHSSNSSLLDFNNLDTLLDSHFKFENYESEV